MATPSTKGGRKSKGDAAGTELRREAQIAAASGVEQARIADDCLGGDCEVVGGDERILVPFGVKSAAMAAASEVIPDGKFANSDAQATRLNAADDAVEMIE